MVNLVQRAIEDAMMHETMPIILDHALPRRRLEETDDDVEEPVEEPPVIDDAYYADPDDSEIPDRGPPASILNEGSPWAAPVNNDRPPFHRSAGDGAAHLLRRRLDAWLATTHDNERTRRDAWGLVGRARVLDEGFLRGGAAEVYLLAEALVAGEFLGDAHGRAAQAPREEGSECGAVF